MVLRWLSSCREPGLGSQHLPFDSQLSLTLVLGNPLAFLSPTTTAHTVHLYTWKKNTDKIKIFKSSKNTSYKGESISDIAKWKFDDGIAEVYLVTESIFSPP